MKKTALFILAVTSLAGCANVDQLRQQAHYQPDWNVCEKAANGIGPIRGVAMQEAQSRGLDCGRYAAQTQARQAADLQQQQMGVQLLQAAQPHPIVPAAAPLPAPSVICTTRPGAGGTTTVCQ